MDEISLRVPTSASEVTPLWLKTALAGTFPATTMPSLDVQRVGEAYGFASRVFRFSWWDNGSRRSVVVKLWDTDGKASIREVLFYQTFRDVGIRVPRCFYGGIDEEAEKAVLVLEDIKDAIQGDVLEPLDIGRATDMARNVARLHATWLEHPMLAELPWLSDASPWELDNDWVDSRRTLFLERFGDRLNGLARILIDQIERAPGVANERLANAPATLLHGDFHLDNVLFEKQDKPVLLDWSRPLKGPLALNVADLLFGMIPLRIFDVIFEVYLDEFNKVAEIPLHAEVLEKRLGGALLRRFASFTCGIALWQPSLPRAIRTIDLSIEHTGRMVEFWQERDPELFSFCTH